MASLKKRGRFWSVQWWWDGEQKIKALRIADEETAERTKQKVEAALSKLKHGMFPKASGLLSQGCDIADIIFPTRERAYLLDDAAGIEDRRADRAGRLLSRLLAGTEFGLLGGWHALRHSFVSICVWKGLAFQQISQWSGHIEPETHRRYTHYVGEASKALMNTLPFAFAARTPRGNA